MNEIKDLKKEFRRHQAISNAKFEYFKDWASKISNGFNEMKEDNDLFYDSMFEIMDRLDDDLNKIKSRLDKANL